MDDTQKIISAQKIISDSILRLQQKSPFFATLALFTQFIPNEKISSAATNGENIFYNPEYIFSLTPLQRDGLLLHEVLHAALLHIPRRGVRNSLLWNYAADIAINGMIMQQDNWDLPPGGLRNTQLEHLSVEEIYEILLKDVKKYQIIWEDMNQDLLEGEGTEIDGDSLSTAHKAALEAHWHNALQQASVIARTSNQGKLTAGIERELGVVTSPQVDWRTYLWRYLVQTPTDFSGFDRRFIGQQLYLETLQGESVNIYVAVDTSGSVDYEQLRIFVAEIYGILSAYPHLTCELYYVDAEAYGPYELTPDSVMPKPKGGGGTSFVPFFQRVAENWHGHNPGICVYLTDGYGEFPSQQPDLPVLWVVTAGGLKLEEFPFGEAVRLFSV
jgi:predicted metal-dependent peptidase